MLVRFIDDYLFVSTSHRRATAFLERMLRGNESSNLKVGSAQMTKLIELAQTFVLRIVSPLPGFTNYGFAVNAEKSAVNFEAEGAPKMIAPGSYQSAPLFAAIIC